MPLGRIEGTGGQASPASVMGSPRRCTRPSVRRSACQSTIATPATSSARRRPRAARIPPAGDPLVEITVFLRRTAGASARASRRVRAVGGVAVPPPPAGSSACPSLCSSSEAGSARRLASVTWHSGSTCERRNGGQREGGGCRSIHPLRASSSVTRPGRACPGTGRSPSGRSAGRGRCRCRRRGPGRARSRGRRSAGSGGRSARP